MEQSTAARCRGAQMNGARIREGGGEGGRTSWAVFIDINVGLITAARPAIMPLCSTCSPPSHRGRRLGYLASSARRSKYRNVEIV